MAAILTSTEELEVRAAASTGTVHYAYKVSGIYRAACGTSPRSSLRKTTLAATCVKCDEMVARSREMGLI